MPENQLIVPPAEPILDADFVKKYKDKPVPWGFGDFSEIVYLRTYSREKEDGRKEAWYETVERCVNGAQAIGAGYTKAEAERLYDYVFNLKGSFAGRGLWQLGTPIVQKMSGASLTNCWVTSVEKIEDFEFLMDMLLLGGGVGYSVERASVHEFPKVKSGVKITHERTTDADVIVPDSRAGWTRLLHSVLKAYFYTGRGFSYSTFLIRGYGAPLKTFGGTASGPEVLIAGINEICQVLENRIGKKIRSVDALDVANIIGKVVCAGGSRRSSQLSVGDPDDYLFIRAKRWDLGGIPDWRSNSNNSILADSYDEIIDEIWKGYSGNGESYGFLNRKLARKTGRLGESINDSKVVATNPCCLAGDSKVFSSIGLVPMNEIEKVRPLLDSRLSPDSAYSSPVLCMYKGQGQTYTLATSDGHSIRATADHQFYTRSGWKKLHELNISDEVATSNESRECLWSIISSITKGAFEGVYDLLETDTHSFIANGFVVHNSEIWLEDGEPCNLTEIFLPRIESQKELIDISKLLYKTQKAITSLNYPYAKSSEVIHRNRRLGQGITGWLQASKDQLSWIDPTYKALKQFDKEWSDKLGISESIKLTTVKPSGTLSLLAGSTPGVHPAFAPYYVRRVRMASSDPLIEYCKQRGYKTKYDIGLDGKENHRLIVVEFPCKSPDNAICASQLTAIEQLEWAVRAQTEWSDNAVSVSIYFSKEELPVIKEWMKQNYETKIKSVSFMLRQDHGFALAPYEEIDEKTYTSLVSQIKNDTAGILETGDGLLNVECEGGTCPIR